MRSQRRPPEYDIIVPGLGTMVGGVPDRLRGSFGTYDRLVIDERRVMLRSLRERHDGLALLRALADKRLTIAELHAAYRQGAAALHALLEREEFPPLVSVARKYLSSKDGVKSAWKSQQQIERFIEFVGGAHRATTRDFTSDRVLAFLSQLTNERTGAPASPATKNRYRAALQALALFAVDNGYLAKSPIGRRLVQRRPEGGRRLPTMTPDEFRRYFEAVRAFAPSAELPLRVMIHTGADVGEVIRAPDALRTLSDPIRVRDLYLDRELPRVRFKRSKVALSPERMVPIPKHLAELLRSHVAPLADSAYVFGDVEDATLRHAHEFARRAIGQPTLRRKDLRHLAAIFWRYAGVDLERIREWLGHRSIMLTVRYAAFGPNDAWDAPGVEKAAAQMTPSEEAHAIA
jgi:site-specific recombinase XerD